MAKNNKKFNILLMISLLIVAVCFALSASGHESEFIKNYGVNFKNNVKVITTKLNIAVPPNVETFLNVPSPSPEPEDDQGIIDKDEEYYGNEVQPDISVSPLEKIDVQGDNINIPLENANTMQFKRYKGYIVCADQSGIMAFDKAGKKLWAVAVQMTKPLLEVNGNYIVVAENGGNKICLFNEKRMIYNVQTEGELVRVAISQNGDVVAVTKKIYYKGCVTVYNKDGEQIFMWNSGNDTILDADISQSTRTLAISLLNTTEKLSSSIKFFNITKKDSYASINYENTILYDVDFVGESLNAVGDDKAVGINTRGKQQWILDYGKKVLTHYQIESSGSKIFAFDNNNISQLDIIDSRGKVRATVNAEIIPDFVDIYSGYTAYNNGREVLFESFSSKEAKKYVCLKDIKNLIIIDNTTVMVVYSTGVEFINFE